MPRTNFNDSFRTETELKKGEDCSLKRHFRNCTREVVGYLDLLAAGDPERFVWPSVPDIAKHCNKYSKAKAPYRQSMVEKSLKFLQELRLICRAKRKRRGAIRTGFIVYGHDMLFTRTHNGCQFTGWGIGEDGLSYEDRAKIRPQITGPITGSITGQITGLITGQITVPITVSNDKKSISDYGVDYGIDSVESAETAAVTQPEPKVSPKFSQPESVPSRGTVSVSQPCDPKKTEETAQTRTDSLTLANAGLTDLRTATPRLCEELKTVSVRDFFHEVGDDALIPKLSDGRIASGTVEQWNGTDRKTKKRDARATGREMISTSRDVIRHQADRRIGTVGHLAEIMVKVMTTYTERTGKKVPEPWLPTIRRMEEDSSLLRTETPLPSPSGTTERVWHQVLDIGIRYAGIDVDANVDELQNFDRALRLDKKDHTYRTCWQALHHHMLERGERPDCLVALRDYFWSVDKLADKPSQAPWDQS